VSRMVSRPRQKAEGRRPGGDNGPIQAATLNPRLDYCQAEASQPRVFDKEVLDGPIMARHRPSRQRNSFVCPSWPSVSGVPAQRPSFAAIGFGVKPPMQGRCQRLEQQLDIVSGSGVHLNWV
jgi:hypothetical protein